MQLLCVGGWSPPSTPFARVAAHQSGVSTQPTASHFTTQHELSQVSTVRRHQETSVH